LEPLNVDFDFVGVSAGGEGFSIQKDLFTLQAYLLTFTGAGDGAGLYAISWNTTCVPEPTSALLGLIGTAVFAFRRRR
ncbi:MAG: PEP-CTERM sorting domain-containing protein, partial [Verrucomicrobiaceae bacterium]